MDEMKVRGFVTPEDFCGTDAEKIQKAIFTAEEKDIRKVVITGTYKTDKTLVIPENMYIVLKDVNLSVTGDFPLFENFGRNNKQAGYAFEEDRFYIEGENADLCGDIVFYNANRVVVNGVKLNGRMYFEFTRESRVQNNEIRGENAVVLARGCNNFIIENTKAETGGAAVVMDTSKTENPYVIGKSAEISLVILKDSDLMTQSPAIALEATESDRIFNIVIENNKIYGTAMSVSAKAGALNAEQYLDITAEEFISSSKPEFAINSPMKHCYIK